MPTNVFINSSYADAQIKFSDVDDDPSIEITLEVNNGENSARGLCTAAFKKKDLKKLHDRIGKILKEWKPCDD